jgi:hypothetical protein
MDTLCIYCLKLIILMQNSQVTYQKRWISVLDPTGFPVNCHVVTFYVD